MKYKTKTLEKILLDVVEHGHDIVWALDTNLIIIYLSEAIEKYGWKRNELIGKSILDIMTEESQKVFKSAVTEYLPNCNDSDCVKFVETINFFNNMKDTFIIESACKLLYNITGKMVGFYGIARDITSKKKLELTNLENERLTALVEIAGGVCHEASQPLQIMSGYIDLLNTTELTSEGVKYLKNLSLSMERLSSLIRKMQTMEDYKTRPYLATKILDIN